MKNVAIDRRGKVSVSDKILQKAAARLLTHAHQLVSIEILYIQRVLGASATQQEIDEKVLAVRKMPWASIASVE